ncbi:sensor histidine kinase [Sphingomonas sp.]|jgi:two-component system CheB/CheR fusion protein|uniref:sensor histidine kinase n=1 Tax=Sphingomonas sp. TaxID=28214 RepID=UPI002ED88362
MVSTAVRLPVETGSAEAWLLTLIEGMPQLIWRAADHGYWTWSSPQWERFTGQAQGQSCGDGWLEALHPDDRPLASAAWDQAPAAGMLDVDLRIANVDGAYRWFQVRALPIRDDQRALTEWLGTCTDIDDLRKLQARQKVLVAELQHRTRNLIAVIHSIATQTLRDASSLTQFGERFDDRLSALSRVQGILSASEDEPITIRKLVQMELAALGAEHLEDRVVIKGEDIVIRYTSAQTLALAIHELSTNALKYGALRSEQGRLHIGWVEHLRDDVPWLCVTWRETGIQPVRATPKRARGYGRTLIEQALPHQLGAKTKFEITGDKLRCSIDLPLEHYQKGDSFGHG